MKKLLFALLFLPMSLFAADFDKIGVDVSGSNDQGVHFGIADSGSLRLALAGEGYTFTFNQDGNDIAVSSYGVELSRSDSKNIGVGYGAGIGIFDGGVHYHWMSSGDHIVGGATTLTVAGVSLETSADWNLSSQDIDGKAGTSVDLWGAQGSVVSNWDIDNLSYDGLDLSAGYSIPVSNGLSVTPIASMGIDDDWSRGDLKVSLSVSMSFGGSHGDL